jgi:hypothetical protein
VPHQPLEAVLGARAGYGYVYLKPSALPAGPAGAFEKLSAENYLRVALQAKCWPVQASHRDPSLEPAAGSLAYKAPRAAVGGGKLCCEDQHLSAPTLDVARAVAGALAASRAGGHALLVAYTGKHGFETSHAFDSGRKSGRREGGRCCSDLWAQWARGFHFGGYAR